MFNTSCPFANRPIAPSPNAPENIYVDDRTIDSHIKRLRKKLRQVDETFDNIETLYGVGYRYKDEA